MISFIKGNIFDSNMEVLVNPVNCEGVMGKGLALEFKKRYPQNFKEYREVCLKGELEPGGELCFCVEKDGKVIVNFPTKIFWRNKSQLGFIRLGLERLAFFMQVHKLSSVAIPALGTGLGGLSWEEVRVELEYFGNLCKHLEIEVYVPKEV